jgi:predicted amidohydrolase
MHVYCIQLDSAWEDKERSFARVRHLLATTAIEKDSLLLLPEMFATGFTMNVGKIAESEDGPTRAFLAEIARQRESTVLGGMVRKGADGKGTNRCLVLGADGKVLADYAKLHPFTFGEEAKHYSGGPALCTFQVGDFTACPTICYDLRFPELYRRAVQKGVTLFTCIASWPVQREAHWVALLQARAIENQCYVAGCNRTGTDPQHRYGGRSLIIDPKGRILADGESGEKIISAAIDLPSLQDYRKSFPALQDIRADLLAP